VLLTKDAHRTLSHSPIDVFSITMIQLIPMDVQRF